MICKKEIIRYKGDVLRTVPDENPWLHAQRFSDQDWCMGIVLLHGRISSCDERPKTPLIASTDGKELN